jgi:hypothetical protein
MGKPSGVMARTGSAGARAGAITVRAGLDASSFTTTGCIKEGGLSAVASISL